MNTTPLVYVIASPGPHGPEPVLSDTGVPLVLTSGFRADAMCKALRRAGYPTDVFPWSRRLAPDVGDLFVELGLDADDLVLVEATATSWEDLRDWITELAERVVKASTRGR